MEEEKTLFDFNTIEEVKENFTPKEIFALAQSDNFSEWLAVKFYTDEAQEVLNAVENGISGTALKLLICKIFNFDFGDLEIEDVEEISAFIARKQRRNLFDKYDSGNKKVAYVENQRELVQALWDGAEVLYLYGAEFKIPLEIPNKVYIGYNNTIIDVTHNSDLDLDSQNIILKNVQIYLHYPINLKMDKSSDVKIINGTKNILGVRPTLKEIFEIMRGRGAFESQENFKRRAEDLRGVAVGTVLLKDENYNYATQNFSIKPQWNFEYMSILKSYATDRNFFVEISPENAKIIYSNERKLQIFADFTYIDGKLTILHLYFESNTLGRIEIEGILRELENKISSGTSGFGGLAYGLDIITAYKN